MALVFEGPSVAKWREYHGKMLHVLQLETYEAERARKEMLRRPYDPAVAAVNLRIEHANYVLHYYQGYPFYVRAGMEAPPDRAVRAALGFRP